MMRERNNIRRRRLEVGGSEICFLSLLWTPNTIDIWPQKGSKIRRTIGPRVLDHQSAWLQVAAKSLQTAISNHPYRCVAAIILLTVRLLFPATTFRKLLGLPPGSPCFPPASPLLPLAWRPLKLGPNTKRKCRFGGLQNLQFELTLDHKPPS